MNIHDPKAHTAAIGVLCAAFAGLAGYGSLELGRPQHAGYAVTAQALDAIPFGKHAYQILAAPDAGDAPEDFAEAIERAGGTAKIDSDMLGHAGIWVSPDTPEGHAIADAISKAIGESVTVGNADDDTFEIGIGHPMHKRGAK